MASESSETFMRVIIGKSDDTLIVHRPYMSDHHRTPYYIRSILNEAVYLVSATKVSGNMLTFDSIWTVESKALCGGVNAIPVGSLLMPMLSYYIPRDLVVRVLARYNMLDEAKDSILECMDYTGYKGECPVLEMIKKQIENE